MWSNFLAWRYRKFRSDFTFYEIKQKLSKSEQKSYISSNIGSMKKADHILELPIFLLLILECYF